MSSRPLTLAIENSNPPSGAGVAIGHAPHAPPDEATVLDVEPIRQLGRDEDDLLPAIARLVERAGVDRRHISRVAVSAGPGGYTSLRVACAAGKMIAETIGALCVPVPTALAVAWSHRASLGSDPFAVALASKGGTAWVTRFSVEQWKSLIDHGQDPHAAGSLTDFAQERSLDIGVLIADKHLPPAMRERATRAGITIVEPVFDPACTLQVAHMLPAVDPLQLLPIYPREPDAVTLWRQRTRPQC